MDGLIRVISALLPSKDKSLYENICRIVGLIIIFGAMAIFLYQSCISQKFKYRNINKASIVIDSTEKFTQEEIQEFIEIAKADFVKWDVMRKGLELKGNSSIYVLNSLTFIKENNDIKTNDVIVFLANYDWYKEGLYYLFNKCVSHEEYWIFIRDDETDQFFLRTKKSTFSPNNVYQAIVGGELKWQVSGGAVR